MIKNNRDLNEIDHNSDSLGSFSRTDTLNSFIKNRLSTFSDKKYYYEIAPADSMVVEISKKYPRSFDCDFVNEFFMKRSEENIKFITSNENSDDPELFDDIKRSRNNPRIPDASYSNGQYEYEYWNINDDLILEEVNEPSLGIPPYYSIYVPTNEPENF